MPRINVECLPVGEMQTNCYLVENTETKELIIADPGADAELIIQRVGGHRPVAVLLTHAHYDHIGAVDAVCSHFDVPLYVHGEDAAKLRDPEKNVGRVFGREVTVGTSPIKLHGGERLSLGGMEIMVLHTPGHSAGSCCFLLPDGQGVLTGDTLFAHGYGRTDFPDGSFHDLRESLRKLFWLSPKMPAYPGHEAAGLTGRDPAEETL